MKNVTKENILYQARLPWIFNILPIIYIIIGFFGVIAFLFALGVIKFLGLCLTLLLCKGILKLLYNITTKVYLTDTKIIIKTGIIVENIIDISLCKLEGVWVSQGLLGKLFNFGCLGITTAGMNISQFINNPKKFRNLINQTNKIY